MDCIILVGGFGTRLKNIVSDVPKPLAPIKKEPFLEFLLKQIESSKIIDRVIFALGYKSELITKFLNERKNQFELVLINEDKPLGTGGGVQKCIPFVKSDNFFVMNGDSYLKINWDEFLNEHKKKPAYATVACTKILNPDRFGTIQIDQENCITSFKEKQSLNQEGIINGGIYCFKKGYLPYHSIGDSFSLEKDLFPKLVNKSVYAYLVSGFFIDIGTEDSYKKAQKTLINQ